MIQSVLLESIVNPVHVYKPGSKVKIAETADDATPYQKRL